LIGSTQGHLMKYVTLALMGIGLAISSTITVGQTPTPTPAPTPKGESELKTVEEKFAYAVGLSIGRNMKAQGLHELDPSVIAKGIKDALTDKPALTDQQIREVQKAFVQVMEAKQDAELAAKAGPVGEKNLKDGQAFLAANKTKPGVTTLPSGLQYKVLKSGTGKTPKLTDTVTANYRGTLIDGTEFDSSAKSGGPVEFPVDGVIKGWIEALQLMKVGDKWQVFIPSELAYGASPRPGGKIKPNDALIFEIELIDVK
jgi:FKBP-type peptidyl-prolyl cis-trans isomerase FklB